MAYQSLALGSSANDGTGDTLRAGGDKINDNFVDKIIFKDHIINNNDDKISYLFSKYEKCVNNEKRKLF